MSNNTSMQQSIISMMDAEITSLSEELMDAKMNFADITLEDGDYRCRDERKTNCKMIEAQIAIVRKMMNEVSSMSWDIKMPALTA